MATGRSRVSTRRKWTWRSNTRFRTGRLICHAHFRKGRPPLTRRRSEAGEGEVCKIRILDRSKQGRVAMDSQKRDESRDRRREEALTRRVGEALDQLAHGDAHDCPDAELIAAYHEKSLQPDEIARWEGHFAICGRCRKILAVLAAAVEEPLAEKEVAHLGELVGATRAPAEAPARRIEPIRPNRLAWRTR